LYTQDIMTPYDGSSIYHTIVFTESCSVFTGYLFGQKDISGYPGISFCQNNILEHPEISHDMSISVYISLSRDTSGCQVSYVGIYQYIYGHLNISLDVPGYSDAA
jgi:hypothetical protein